jgi:hypothetical protein
MLKQKENVKHSDTNRNNKFKEIQKKDLELLKKRVSVVDDSDEEEYEVDKAQVVALFKNYQGDEIDLARIARFFDSGENVDCLICNK